jgi:PPOX class probable F420-dependent enzyme
LSRRAEITMSAAEQAAFVASQRVVICGTHGPRGWPHLMPLWYVLRDGELWAWSYARSQKVRNLERDARATLQIEAGDQYHELRGVMIEARVTIHRDRELVAELGAELMRRYGGKATGRDFMDAVRAQAAKRAALQFTSQRVASWDHRKLSGVY